jgi:hypothetical protein
MSSTTATAEMDVQVKLWLQGGHVWEFCCDEDDPIVFGLVSALPGVDSGANLPPNGLIQIETRTGERLFLTSSSLVSVDIVRVTDEMQLLAANRLAAPLPDSYPSTPAPFVLVPNALPDEVHRVLVDHVLVQGTEAKQQPVDGIFQLNLFPLVQAIEEGFRVHVDKGRSKLNIPETSAVRFELFAIGDGKSMTWKNEADEIGSLIYQFHKRPKAFTGGGIRLFDSRTDSDARESSTFRDLEIKDNSVLIMPEKVVSAGLPVHCPTRAFADGLFVLRGSIRHRQTA